MIVTKVKAIGYDMYTCCICGFKATGDKYTWESDYPDIHNFIELLSDREYNFHPGLMPIYWSSNLVDGELKFKCPKCNKE